VSEHRDRDQRLGELLADVLRSGRPDPETLLRYARAPQSLGAEQRASVETWMASSPANRDQVELLRRVDVARLVERSREPEPATPWSARIRAWLEARLPQGGFGPGLALAGAAAAVLLAVWLGLRAAGPGAPVEGATPERIARAPELPEAPPAPAPAPPEPLPAAPAARPVPPAPEPPQRVRPAAPLPPEWTALAQLEYSAPAGAAARERAASSIRGDVSGPELVALVPAHVARTAEARPSLFWYLSELPAQGSLRLRIADGHSIDPLLDVELPRPAAAGLQRTRLSGFGAELRPGVAYRWSVALILDPENPSRATRSEGWIERVAPPALEEREPAARVSALARAGLWYDALAALDDLALSSPGASEPRAALRSMLDREGLGDVAARLR
jgi:hypothetical protein